MGGPLSGRIDRRRRSAAARARRSRTHRGVSDVRHDVHRAIEAVARQSYGRLIAYLAARTGDVAGAEDALSDALVAALGSWAKDGVPNSPEAWLLTAARRRLIDQHRHRRVQTDHASTIDLLADEPRTPETAFAFPDERLKLLFVCAHPAIDPAMHTPLMLQTVLGLDAAAIARAFIVAPATMSQRLVRAKTKIREAGIAFEIPDGRQLAPRLDAVLNAIYAAYGSGWDSGVGATGTNGLVDEAIWLARALNELLPDVAEVRGLLALMLHCEARRGARRASDGRFVPLSEQDTRLWNAAMLEEAERELSRAAALARPGRFQLEAAIQSVHAERARTQSTDWRAIALLYEGLMQIAPTLGARVGRAAAVAEVRGADAGLALLETIDAGAVVAYQPYWAVRAHLLKKVGRTDDAKRAFGRAIELADDPAIKRFLQQQANNEE